VTGSRDPTLEIVITNFPDLTEARLQDFLGLDRPNLAGRDQAMAVEGKALKEGAPIEHARRASTGEGLEEVTNEKVTDLLTVGTAMTASVDRPKEGRAAPDTAVEVDQAMGVNEAALVRFTNRRVNPSEAHIKATENRQFGWISNIHVFWGPLIEKKPILSGLSAFSIRSVAVFDSFFFGCTIFKILRRVCTACMFVAYGGL